MKKTTFHIPDGGKSAVATTENDSISDMSASFTKPMANKSQAQTTRTNTSTLSSLVANNRAMLRPIYLTFKAPDLEIEYAKYFIKYNIVRWQRANCGIFGFLAVFAY
eukprot:jgi/Hompol1/6057/HPOL_000269-RA